MGWFVGFSYLVAYYGWIVAIPVGYALHPKIQARTGKSKGQSVATGIGLSLLVYFIVGVALVAISMLVAG